MTDTVIPSQFQGSNLLMANDGSPMLPGTPAEARARLAALNADKAVGDVLLDVRHPQHQARLAERRGLELIAARDKPAQVAADEVERQRQNASLEAAESAGVAGRLGIYRDLGGRS
ncbi:hypothetical protein EN868_11165 [Mesorhizobium sp. M2D.F.Ca.ET.225.01.1.1]|uniref:hypothetical protein n=1 Tax=unclassified Mesorhizobium TaxID=325217 RepID=UPI000FD46C2C|nr:MULTISPECIES: hypothetical protein [unclassified Mesorhizobium]TGP59544.1 hypothetical protein EN869_014835 [Mesorhizobium sp. M2D.F.Ca.ET.226.01.1.1]TGP69179.1 hypothetical protein EN868_11165 [Mesorhizobium sp. M2D.F.Ca.ET.225.01.1.1]